MIRTLNLDSMFVPVPRPEIEYDMMKFSGGELHIKLNNDIDYSDIHRVIITHRIRSSACLMAVLIAKDALELKGVKHFDLVMPYVPYARQDRKCSSGESFTLKVFSRIINSANFDKVICIDPHSDVAPALINNCSNVSNSHFLKSILPEFDSPPILISPDAGANKKSNQLAVEFELELVKCDKVRDVKTGGLSGFEVFCDDLNQRECLIVDDICDGGGTFLGLLDELKNKNAGDVSLFTTHGIYSKGIEILTSKFKSVYCTNSFNDVIHPSINQIKIQL